MNQKPSFELSDVNLDVLKTLFNSSLLCDSKLGFTLYPDGTITSIAGNATFYKKWSANISEHCGNFVASIQEPIKTFLLDGNKFKNKVLAFNTANLKFYTKQINGVHTTQKIELESGPVKLNVACTTLSLGFIELTPQMHKIIFENTTNIRSLFLTSSQLKTLSYYGSLNTSGKISEGIELKTAGHGLVASDGSFEYVVDANYDYDLKPISLFKSSLRFIDDNEEYDITIATTPAGRDAMTFKAKNKDLVMTFALMENIADYADDDDDYDLPF